VFESSTWQPISRKSKAEKAALDGGLRSHIHKYRRLDGAVTALRIFRAARGLLERSAET
jgi:hypothetical protein